MKDLPRENGHRAAPTVVTFGSERVRRVEAGPFAVSAAVFPAGSVIPSHYHAWGCVSVILEGRFLQRFPGRDCDCPAGTVLAKPPGERHEDRWFAAPSHHVIIEVDPGRHHELGASRDLVEEVWHLRALGATGVAQRMLVELAETDDATALALEGLALELLAYLHRLGREPDRPSAARRWLGEVRDYLHDNFRSDIRLGDLARLVDVHPDHLSRTFSAAFGRSIGEYVRRLRVEAAMGELVRTDDPIAEIAYRCGFSDQSHLTRLLRQKAGITPRAYRAVYRARTVA